MGPSLQFSNLSSASRTSGSRAKRKPAASTSFVGADVHGHLTAQARPSGHDARRRPCRRRRDFRGGVGVVIGAAPRVPPWLLRVPTCRRVTTTTRSPRRARTRCERSTLAAGGPRELHGASRGVCVALRAPMGGGIRWPRRRRRRRARRDATARHGGQALTRTRRDTCATTGLPSARCRRAPRRRIPRLATPRRHHTRRSARPRRERVDRPSSASYRARDETPFDSTLVPPPLPQSSRLDPRPTSALSRPHPRRPRRARAHRVSRGLSPIPAWLAAAPSGWRTGGSRAVGVMPPSDPSASSPSLPSRRILPRR